MTLDPQWVYIVLVIVLAVVPEVGVALWWSSAISTRIKALEKDKDHLYKELDGMNSITTRLSVMEVEIKNMSHVLDEVRDELRKR